MWNVGMSKRPDAKAKVERRLECSMKKNLSKQYKWGAEWRNFQFAPKDNYGLFLSYSSFDICI